MPPEITHGLSTAGVSSALPEPKKPCRDGSPSSSSAQLLDMSRPSSSSSHKDSQPQSRANRSSNNSNRLNNNSSSSSSSSSASVTSQQPAMFMLGLPPCSGKPTGKSAACPLAKRAPAPAPAAPKETTTTAAAEIASLSPTELVKRLDVAAGVGGGTGRPGLVLVDCRSFLAYNRRHIEGAVGINCTNCLTKRRLQQGKLTLNDLATTDEGRDVLRARKDKDVVVYDEDTRRPEDLPNNHPTLLVLNSLRNEGSRATLLTGGFKEFQNQFGLLCKSLMAENGGPDDPPSAVREPAAPHAPPPDCPTAAKLKEIDVPATRLLTFLYVGNEKDAADLDWLRQERIANVLNVTQSVPCFYQDDDAAGAGGNINYRRISARDNALANLKRHFEEAFVFIEAARRRHERVLIHCSAGISRSSTIAIAYIMRYRGMSMSKAYNLVKSRRPIINPNLNFVGQLAAYEKALMGQGIPSQCGRHHLVAHRRTASPHPLPPTLETAL